MQRNGWNWVGHLHITYVHSLCECCRNGYLNHHTSSTITRLTRSTDILFLKGIQTVRHSIEVSLGTSQELLQNGVDQWIEWEGRALDFVAEQKLRYFPRV